jgi:hypothetical protein
MSKTASISEPIRFNGVNLVPATCLACRALAWHLPSQTCADGRAMLFDAQAEGGELYVLLHGCHYSPRPGHSHDDIDDDQA